MARLDVSVSSDMAPEQAWESASDLHRFDEWLTVFRGWRSEVPSTIEKGTRVSSCIRVKGFRNVIRWEVTRYEPPTRVDLTGRGRGGIRITLNLTVKDTHPGSTFHLVTSVRGGVLSGPVGALVVRVLKSDVRKSVTNLARMRPSRTSG